MTSPFNKRNKFNLTHEKKFTCDMGKLTPFYLQSVIPGDTFNVHTDAMVRLQALIAPIYHRVNVYTHFFFVPNRIVMDDWENFITGGKDGNDNTVFPTVTLTPTLYSLADYFGLPLGHELTVSALPFRAYNKIYNDWYRNETLQDEVSLSTGSGSDTTTSLQLLKRNWQRDYFTSALPFRQRGDAVRVPLGTTAPVYGGVVGNGKTLGLTDGTNTGSLTFNTTNAWALRIGNNNNATIGETVSEKTLSTLKALGILGTTSHSGLKIANDAIADLSEAGSATINDWRLAFQIQRLLEKNARGGYRYIEWLYSHFGVKSSDARLQRAEYLGGGKAPIAISEIVQTSASDDTSPQGNMAGHGFSAQRSHSFTKSFEEHGYIIGIMSIMPITNYQQGIERDWLYHTRYEFPLPVLSHLGEQGIYNKELYVDGTSADDEIFGYAPQYEECRHKYSQVAGDFRNSLNFWHMGRIFENRPNLNSEFVTSDPTKRIFATVETGQHCLVDLVNSVRAFRPLPKHGNPGLIDHD